MTAALADAPTVFLPRVPAERPAPDSPAAEAWALVERAQAGESEAFGLIYDKYFDTVFKFIYFRVGNRQLAEDLTGDTFLRALKRIGSVTWQGRDFGAWLVTIARNLVADHFKSGRYRLEVLNEPHGMASYERELLASGGVGAKPKMPIAEMHPEEAVVNHSTNLALLAAVDRLKPDQKQCIVLRFFNGMSVAETAAAMNREEGAIKSLQYRAVKTLRRLLPEGFER